MRNRKAVQIMGLALLTLMVSAWGGCGWFSKGTATLKAQSVTVDTVVMAGEMFFLVAGPFDALCPQRALPLETCRGWRLFVEGHAPADPVCQTPTIPAILTVLDRCGYKKAYPFVVQQYQAKKDVAVSVASTAEAIVKQLTGFGKAVNAAKKGV